MKKFEEVLQTISKDQQQLEAYENNNSLVIKAGPGSGKTTILSMKLAKLIKEQVKSPRKVACITFSNEATRNLERKIQTILEPTENNFYISTIHSFCLSQIIKPFLKLFNYGISEEFLIVTDEKKEKILSDIKEELDIPPDQVTLMEMDKERTLLIDGLSQIKIENYDLAKKVAMAYEEYLIKNNLVDFISIVKLSTHMIQNQKYIRQCLEARYPYILIDEYQDLGRPLHEMVLCLAKNTKIKIIAVGDSDQSIYGFNGAMPDFFEELKSINSFDVIELVNNYRSEKKIVDASSKMLNSPKKYISKVNSKKNAEINLIRCEQNHDDQLKHIVNNLIPNSQKNGVSYGEIAILLPSKNKIYEMINYLDTNNIPYYISNKEYARTEFIIWLENCMGWLLKSRDVLFKDLFEQWLSIKGVRTSNAKEIVREKTILYRVLTNSISNSKTMFEWLKYLHENFNFKQSLKESVRYTESIESFKALVVSVKRGRNINLSKEEFSSSGIQGDKVALLTRHSSKGLEFEVVIVPLVEDGSLPFYKNFNNPQRIEEEKRVLFVCLTRAKNTCYLLMSKRINGYPKNLSRFLQGFAFDKIIDM
ncbi:ATP-dependent helicase [Halalkalibacter nanhaiisediminis]|uniref:DNA 3'-5' helicase n=1 Tax=Halalkalibacter nanhaiisediminis TaxID=688079 RepID=A0A562QHB1_9BACI|nr:ATP-dependent helicase [Halalkalibacter nanhaiisediminis]TWI56105.1 DNA helicase-2/ATP-dependent DNA helicase PcrA [Halalkalibacter nanhaiisediminis]